MATPTPKPVRLGRSVLTRFLGIQRKTDAEIRRLLLDLASEADRTIAGLSGAPSNAVRGAQLRLAAEQADTWIRIQAGIETGLGNTADGIAKLMGQFDRPYLRSMGIDPAAWARSLEATARRGVVSYLARGENGITLSERIYKNAALTSGRLGRLIDTGLLLGKSAREIAKDVRRFISPNAPGGMSYAAFRLGRTELNNAFHRSATDKYADTPWVDAVKWNLSGSHSRPDVCDEYAGDVHMRNGNPGEFAPGDVPGKPHPQCFCYIEPVPMDPDEFVSKFLAGGFDRDLDRLAS